jgi:hypothetical protein
LQDESNALHLGTEDIDDAGELRISKRFGLQDIILCSIQVDTIVDSAYGGRHER